jgi:hypothetical protein
MRNTFDRAGLCFRRENIRSCGQKSDGSDNAAMRSKDILLRVVVRVNAVVALGRPISRLRTRSVRTIIN